MIRKEKTGKCRFQAVEKGADLPIGKLKRASNISYI